MDKAYKKIIIFLLAIAYLCYIVQLDLTKQVLLKTMLNLLRNTIHISLLVVWCVSIYNRILNRRIRNALILVGILMIFWLNVRTCKWLFLDKMDVWTRYLWYCFYIPMIFIPFLGTYIIDQIGQPIYYKTPKKIYYLFVIASILLIVIFTNDFHRMVFDFPEGIKYFDCIYIYKWFYWIIVGWFVGLGIYFCMLLLKKSRVPGNKMIQRIPICILVVAIVLWCLYALKLIHYDLTAVDCIMITLLLETSIQSGLILSNKKYKELFYLSTINAHIVDWNYNICFSSRNSTELSKDIMKRAENQSIQLTDTILHSKKISGGYILWQDDIKKTIQLMNELNDVQQQLSKGNALLKEEIDLEEKYLHVKEKNRLYDAITQEVKEQLKKVDFLIRQAEVNQQDRKNILSKIAVVNVYIKRRGNLLLLQEEYKEVSSKELEYCIRESLDHIRICDILTSLDSQCYGRIRTEVIIEIFDLYERIIELFLDNMNALLIHLFCNKERIRLCFQIGCTQEMIDEIINKICELSSNITYTVEEEDIIIEVSWGKEEQ